MAAALASVADALRANAAEGKLTAQTGAPGCAGTPGASQLIIHVGPGKTGTTSFQEYIHANKDWIRTAHGVRMVTTYAEEGHHFVWHLVGGTNGQLDSNQEGAYYARLTASLRDALQVPGATVLISSELFTALHAPEWRTFLGDVSTMGGGAAKVEVRVVQAHRSIADVIRSEWAQFAKSGHPFALIDQIAAYSAEHEATEPDRELLRLSVLQDVFGPKCVHGVSYEGLKDEQQSMAAFVLCTVIRGSEGAEWRRCAAEVDARGKPEVNDSPSSVALDAVRLAKLAWDVRPPSDACSGVKPDLSLLTIHKDVVDSVTSQLPQKCMSFDSIFAYQDEMWYQRAGVEQPRKREHPVCVVDQGALTHRHWQLLQQLLPPCAGGQGAAAQ